jgi:hypothetical protein
MDLVAVVQAYILRILEEAGPGMKVHLNMYIATFPCTVSSSVRIRIGVRRFLGFLDLDPVIRGSDPAPDPSVNNQK